MEFQDLIDSIPDINMVRHASGPVLDVVNDSRKVRAGACFVCRRGLQADGHLHVDEAIQRGAVAVVAERPVDVPAGVGLAIANDGRRGLAAIARRFWGEPDQRLGVVGVTGTDGKTTTSRLIAWMLGAYVGGVGELTTVNARAGGKELSRQDRLTTPEAPVIAQLLQSMVEAGDEWAVLEVASHALELARVDGFAFNRAVMTNVTHDHLDLHGSLEGYRDAKRQLLQLLDAAPVDRHGKAAVLNADDPVVMGFADGLTSDVLTFGQFSPADVQVHMVDATETGMLLAGSSPWGAWEAEVPIVGRWVPANVAAAVACVGSVEGRITLAVDRLATFHPVEGRMEAVSCGQPFSVIVDHAHTPAALSMCLEGLRESTSGRLLVVFGSAGDQDSSKRPLLGFQVARFADVAVIANEDPRSECPDDIARAVMCGRGKTSAIFEIIHDRAEAIKRVLEMAVPGDTVLLAGKGHERTIEFSEDVQPWNEREVAEGVLRSLGYRSDV